MKIIEFCGNPGCGKSYICDKLEQELKTIGYKVINIQKREKCNTLRKKIKKVIKIIRYKLYADNKKLKKFLYDIAKDEQSKKFANRILEVNYLLAMSIKQKYDYILLDEGCIQFLSSIDYDPNNMSEIYFELLKTFYKNKTTVFYCNINISENIKRIRFRNKKNDRFLHSSDKVMKELLENKNNKIGKIMENIGLNNVYRINLNENFEKNYKKIKDLVIK